MIAAATVSKTPFVASLAMALLGAPEQQPVQGEQSQAAAPGGAAADIIITARRRAEPLGRAGAPVSVLGGEEIVESGVSQTDRLNERFPALTVQPTATGNLIFIRGVGNFTLLPNSDPAVGFAYDGIFISRPMGTMGQFFDLERIELLKGPQGVLYGRNASAGSINLEPRQPVLGKISADFHLSAATRSQEQAEAALNVPLGGGAALRLSAAMSEQDHFLSGYDEGPEQHSARVQFKALLGERAIVRVAADYNHLGGTGVGTSYVGNYVFVPEEGRYAFIQSRLPLSDGLYSREAQQFRQTITAGSSGRTLDALSSRPRQSHHFYGAHARIDADLGFADLALIPAWRRSSIDAVVSGSPFGYRQLEKDEQSSAEARLSGRSGKFEWLAGGLLFNESIDADTSTNLSSSLALAEQRYGTRSRALFGNATLHLAPSLRLSGGLRWTRDRKSYRSNSQSLAIICQRRIGDRLSCPTTPLFQLVDKVADIGFPVPAEPGGRQPITVGGIATGAIVTRTARQDAGRLVDGAVTWRLGAEADIGSRTLVYATGESGYRPGGFNTAVGFETFEPERITAYTAGLRHRGFAERLQLDLEAFWWDYRDQHVSSLRPDLSSPPRNANITENIGSSRIRGIEADARVEPWAGGQLGAVVQLLSSDYRTFTYVQANTGVRPLTGCEATLSAVTNLYTIDCAARQPYNSPRWSMSLSGRQSVPLGRATLTFAADTHYRAARNIGFAFLPEQRVRASWTSNAQLIFRAASSRFQVAAFVRNIEGKRTPQFMIFHPVSNALVAGTSPPRQWGLRASLPLEGF